MLFLIIYPSSFSIPLGGRWPSTPYLKFMNIHSAVIILLNLTISSSPFSVLGGTTGFNSFLLGCLWG